MQLVSLFMYPWNQLESFDWPLKKILVVSVNENSSAMSSDLTNGWLLPIDAQTILQSLGCALNGHSYFCWVTIISLVGKANELIDMSTLTIKINRFNIGHLFLKVSYVIEFKF